MKNARNLDKNGFRKRAACVCIQADKPDCTLLISSSRNNGFWIFPGGGIESKETSEDAALRELGKNNFYF